MPLPLSLSLSFQQMPLNTSSTPSAPHHRQRPRGLWKARGSAHQQQQPMSQQHHAQSRFSAPPPPPQRPAYPPRSYSYRSSPHYSSDSDDQLGEVDDEEEEKYSSHSTDSTSSSRKRRKRESPDTPASSEDEVFYWDYARKCSTSTATTAKSHTVSQRTVRDDQDDEGEWTTRTKFMDISSTAEAGTITDDQTCDIEDWEDLKELFAKAAEVYEADDPNETLPLLRGVIHECHRFLLFYQDPSVLFMNSRTRAKKEEPLQFFELKEWTGFPPPDKVKQRSQSRAPPRLPTPPPKKCKCLDLPTAFHTILGTALFFFGNLIAQHPDLALPGEPPSPIPYWLAALDVFETGENLPTKTSDFTCDSMPEDWRMAVIWGRTLVNLAEEVIKREGEERKKGVDGDPYNASAFVSEEPEWPLESPFSAIAARRPPVTRRMSMAGSSANEILVLAMDQFSRGIFHMPHAHNHRSPLPSTSYFSHLPVAPTSPPTSSSSVSTPSTPGELSFSRAKELYTIANEVLWISEKLSVPSERAHWASWADSVFQQMKMESDTDAWRGSILEARGRCWLVVGSARAEEMEDALERGEASVLYGEEAREAREGLEMALGLFEKARDESSSSSGEAMEEDDDERDELKSLMAEVLVTLANLTPEEDKRETLYQRAKEIGGGLVMLDGDEEMDVE